MSPTRRRRDRRLRPRVTPGRSPDGREFTRVALQMLAASRAVQLAAVPVGEQGSRTDLGTSATRLPKSNHETDRRLRAILRAPAEVSR